MMNIEIVCPVCGSLMERIEPIGEYGMGTIGFPVRYHCPKCSVGKLYV